MQWALVILGLVLLALGVLWPWVGRLGLGHLPGDLYWRSGPFAVYSFGELHGVEPIVQRAVVVVVPVTGERVFRMDHLRYTAGRMRKSDAGLFAVARLIQGDGMR